MREIDIKFNVPPYVDKAADYIQECVKNQKICGDGEYTKKCNAWIEERTGAVECLLHAHFADRLVHRFDDGGRQRAGDVADAQTDDVRIGMRGAVRLHAASDFRKQVRTRQTGKIIVDMKHSYLPFYILY